eukprot:2056489-Amphidinium_carterae.1
MACRLVTLSLTKPDEVLECMCAVVCKTCSTGQLVVSLLWAHLPLAHGQVAACQELLDSTGSIPEDDHGCCVHIRNRVAGKEVKESSVQCSVCKDCGRAWGITNAANVREYWEARAAMCRTSI